MTCDWPKTSQTRSYFWTRAGLCSSAPSRKWSDPRCRLSGNSWSWIESTCGRYSVLPDLAVWQPAEYSPSRQLTRTSADPQGKFKTKCIPLYSAQAVGLCKRPIRALASPSVELPERHLTATFNKRGDRKRLAAGNTAPVSLNNAAFDFANERLRQHDGVRKPRNHNRRNP